MNPIQFFKDGYAGKNYSVFKTDYADIGILICYDMDYSFVSRNIVRNGAEVLFIPTYDAMWWGELQHIQHSTMTLMRAVENKRFVIRTASSGISQIVDPNGRVLKSIGIGDSDIEIGKVQKISEKTFYTNYGFLFPFICIIFLIIIFILVFLRNKKIKF